MALNGHLADQTVFWNGAFEYIDSLNHDVYGGRKNWRLPSREELETQVNHVQEEGFGSNRVGTVAAGLHALSMKNIRLRLKRNTEKRTSLLPCRLAGLFSGVTQ